MAVKRPRRKVVKLKRPPDPVPCREMPEPNDAIDTVNRYHHWLDERDKRRSVHANLDESLQGVIPLGGTDPIVPSTLLYAGRLTHEELAWDQRWWVARSTELGHFAIGNLLTALAPDPCRRDRGFSVASAVFRIGNRVHKEIQYRYLASRRANRISLDNRVHTLSGSETLSVLAARNRRGEFDALNFALAGTRADIVDFTTREMFEIKPATLASEAVLQLWAYLDNHEVARVFAALTDDAVASIAPFQAGNVTRLPKPVLEQFTLQVRGLRVPLTITPYVVDRLPGLILYTVGTGSRQGKGAAAAAMAAGRANVNQLLLAAGRTEQQRREAAIAAWELATNTALVTYWTSYVILALFGAAYGRAAPSAGTGTGMGTVTSIGTGAGAGVGAAAPGFRGAASLLPGGAEVARLTDPQPLKDAVRQAVEKITSRAPPVVTFETASGQFVLPPEAGGAALDAGVRAGSQLADGGSSAF